MLAHIARHPHLRVHPSPRSPVEVHKTFDHANYHKSADIGQMLIVYEDEYAMEEAKNERGYRVDLPVVLPLGVDPPHEEGGAASIPVEVRGARREARPAAEVGRVLVERELVEMMSKLSTGKGKPKSIRRRREGGGDDGGGGGGRRLRAADGRGGGFTVDDVKMHGDEAHRGGRKEEEARGRSRRRGGRPRRGRRRRRRRSSGRRSRRSRRRSLRGDRRTRPRRRWTTSPWSRTGWTTCYWATT